MQIIKSLLVIFIIFNLSSCKEEQDDSSNQITPSHHQLLTSKFVHPNVWTEVLTFSNSSSIEGIQLLLGDAERCRYQAEEDSISILLGESEFCAFQYVSQDSNLEKSYGVLTASSVQDPNHTDMLRYKAISLLENAKKSVNLKKMATPLSSLNHDATLLDEALVITSDGDIYPYLTSAEVDSLDLVGPLYGIDRVIYAYQQANGDVLQGVIFVSRTEDNNASPSANPSIKNIDINTVTTVDVSELISDTDDDNLQLIAVINYDNLANIEDVSDVTNTKFTFSSDKAGTYDTYYIVSDHHGGLATSFVRFNVSAMSGSISDIYVTPVEGGSEFIYSYPENVEQADSYQHGGYSGIYTEVGDLGLNGESYPFYSYSHANAVCVLKGLKLPTTSEMDVLWSEKGPLFSAAQWPTTIPYIVYDADSGKPMAYNMHDGSTGTPSEDAQGYVTCVGYSYDRITIQEKFAAKNAQRKLHILPYANDVIVPVHANIVEWLVSDPSLASISSSGVLTTFDNDGVVTVTAVSDTGLQATQEITITDNLLTLYGEQDPTFDKGVDAAGINYSNPCTDEDHDLFFELTGFENTDTGGVGTTHYSPILCTNNADRIPYSGKGYIVTNQYQQGGVGGSGIGSYGSSTSILAYQHTYPADKRNQILSASVNLEDLLKEPSLSKITTFSFYISTNLKKSATATAKYGQLIISFSRNLDDPTVINDISLVKSDYFYEVENFEFSYDPKTFWLSYSVAGVVAMDFLLEPSYWMEFKFSNTPMEGDISSTGANYTTIFDEIGTYIY